MKCLDFKLCEIPIHSKYDERTDQWLLFARFLFGKEMKVKAKMQLQKRAPFNRIKSDEKQFVSISVSTQVWKKGEKMIKV